MNKDGCLALVGYGECQGWIYMKQMTLKLGLEKKTQTCLTWKGLKISLPYAHFPQNLEALAHI